MREIVRTNDAVLVSAISALLDGANIQYLVLDQNMSVLEGSLGVLPRRILVADAEARQARPPLENAAAGRRGSLPTRSNQPPTPCAASVWGGASRCVAIGSGTMRFCSPRRRARMRV